MDSLRSATGRVEVAKLGEGEAASLAALGAIACLRKGVCMQPLPAARHSFQVQGPRAFEAEDEESRAVAFGAGKVAVSTEDALANAGVRPR